MIAPLVLALAPLQATPTAEIPPELAAELRERPAEKHRVYAELHERLGLEDLLPEVQGLPRGERQRAVAARLRAFADARQGGVLARLAELEAEGEVERVQQLWIANAVVFRGTARAIEAVAELPEVARIGWDPVRDPAIYHDVLPAPPAPPSPTAPPPAALTTYFSTGFETGLPPGMATATTGCGTASTTSLHGPKTGSSHFVMASSSDSCSGTATLTLALDLTGVTTASVRYAFKDMNDEFDPGLDVLEASDDGGATWVKVADLTGSDGVYLLKTHALDPLGLVYGPGFRLRWRWSDNFTAPTYGFAIDDVEIADFFPPPPPPSPEPNLVQLQAPALWSLGFDGTGAVLMNIDDGTDRDHPDLAGRIWTNPLDPANGIDDDGNGFVDDTWGWDFLGGDNDPSPTSSHGTQTAGIMVGDGSSGIALTGMAPGAKLAVARISGETDHWLAQQWGISVAVDCSSSSHSYKWYFSPKPNYHMHRQVEDMVLAAGIVHANSIGNDGTGSAPVPFQISAPGLSPSPWRHSQQSQVNGGVSGVLACGGIELNDTHYSFSSHGPSAWESLQTYDPSYPHAQSPAYWDYPVGGFGGGGQGLLKPDLVTYTNVETTLPGGGYSTFGGTSAATPHLGGALALLLGAQPAAEPRHVAQALQITAKDLGVPGKDASFGAGKVQVLDAALRLLHLVKVDDPTPKIGTSITLSVHGAPNELFLVLASPTLGKVSLGFAEIDLAAPWTLLAGGFLDGTGTFQKPITVPNDPTLVGVDVHVQSGADDRQGTTGQFLVSTIETIRAEP